MLRYRSKRIRPEEVLEARIGPYYGPLAREMVWTQQGIARAVYISILARRIRITEMVKETLERCHEKRIAMLRERRRTAASGEPA